jgi:hypothetical protein
LGCIDGVTVISTEDNGKGVKWMDLAG